MARWFLVFAAGLLLVSAAAAQLKPFAELWNNIGYFDTNIERKGFASVLGRFEGKLGAYLFDSPYQAYGAYYGVSSQSPDYWDNAVYYGLGFRFKPLEQFKSSGWQDEWVRDVKIFAESLAASFLKDRASGEANRRADLRYGLDLWHEWNLDNPDVTNYWGELWSNFSFRSTNFSYTDFNGYIIYLQPKIGKHLGRGIEPYVKLDLTYSDKPDYWLNIF